MNATEVMAILNGKIGVKARIRHIEEEGWHEGIYAGPINRSSRTHVFVWREPGYGKMVRGVVIPADFGPTISGLEDGLEVQYSACSGGVFSISPATFEQMAAMADREDLQNLVKPVAITQIVEDYGRYLRLLERQGR